ncbi:hypothetical protein ABEB36_007139 [Hypothenemus hampei]|uniref:Adhesin domain-containing protein n=1 Tax=Hypothenemus hampei TaxID=57062 RepID=A0ABD1ETG5_HYPHA
MPFLKNIAQLKAVFKPDLCSWILKRPCSDLSIVKTQLEVPTFCDIHVDLACKVRIKPFNVHKYHNANAFLLQTDFKYDNSIDHYIDGNKVIVRSLGDLNPNTLCSIKAPVKANLHIKAKNDVSLGYFQGDKINVHTEGNVFVDRFQGDSLDVITTNGNIILNDHVHASNVSAVTTNGSIKTGKLQGLSVKLKVLKQGNLKVGASYGNESIFVVENGEMELQNLHKNCKVFLMKGHLTLTGFDGQLSAIINSGSADVYLSRITASSDITLKDPQGILLLKTSEACRDSTMFKISARKLNNTLTAENGTVIIKPDGDDNGENVVLINCENDVRMETVSWQEMMELQLKNK